MAVGHQVHTQGGGGHAGQQHQARAGNAHVAIENQTAGHEVAQIRQEPGQEESMRRAQRSPVQRIQDRHAQNAHHPQRAPARRAARIQKTGQRGEQVQAHDHVQVPKVVIRFALRHLARPERKIDTAVVPPVQTRAPGQVEQRPEQERRTDTRHASAIELAGVMRFVRVQQQGAADHHKHGHAPACRRVVEIGGQPGALAVGGRVTDDERRAVQQDDRHGRQPAGGIQAGITVFGQRHRAPAGCFLFFTLAVRSPWLLYPAVRQGIKNRQGPNGRCRRKGRRGAWLAACSRAGGTANDLSRNRLR
ncbi:hypothetical protein D3C73_731320 [compost metagenome]